MSAAATAAAAVHPARVPPGFVGIGGELAVAGRQVSAWATELGTPMFLYDRALIDARIAALRAALPPGVRLSYAMKANPMPEVVAHLGARVDAVDIASGGELAVAAAAGVDPARISFAGPGKRDGELAAAIEAGVLLNVESAGELARAVAIGRACGRTVRAALRINPDFELKGSGMRMGGGARPFGVDAEAAPDVLRAMRTAGVAFEGFQIFAGSQNLDADRLIDAQAATLALAARLATSAPGPVRHLNMGGGFGVPYFPADRPLDLARVGAALGRALAVRPAVLAGAEVTIELGRYLVAEAGVYVARVVDVKSSRGTRYAVLDGGLHHQLAASGNFGTVLRRNYPLVNASRFDAAAAGPVTVVGPLCTPLDLLGDAVALPETRVGDLVALFLAGAYGRSASPSRFLGHPEPAEALV